MAKNKQKLILALLGIFFVGLFFTNNSIYQSQDSRNQASTNQNIQANPPQNVAPVFYIMHDRPGFQDQFIDQLPNHGALGGWFYVGWKQVEPEKNQFNWGPIEEYLASESQKTTQLKNGQILKKPIALSIQIQGNVGQNAVPDYIYNVTGRNFTATPKINGQVCTTATAGSCANQCTPDLRPPWEHQYFQERFKALISAFGQKYNNDPRVNSIWIASGVYGENVTTATGNCEMENINVAGCSFRNACRFDYSPGGVFGNWLIGDNVLETYRSAFPNKALIMINSAPTGRLETTLQAAQLSPPIGIKHNALDFDLPDQTYSDNSQWPTINTYWQKITDRNQQQSGIVGFEHFFANNPESTYWALLAGLSRGMTLIDLPKDHLTVLAQIQNDYQSQTITAQNSGDYFPLWSFVEDHMGRLVTNTPSAWIVLRDTLQTRGEPGDWEFYLYRPENIAGQQLKRNSGQDKTIVVTYDQLPDPAKQQLITRAGTTFRRTDQATGNPYMYFNVDDNWPALTTTGFNIEITYLDQGTDTWELKYGPNSNQKQIITKNNTGKFIRHQFNLPSLDLKQTINSAGDNFRIDCKGDGDDTIHMVQVTPQNWQAPLWNFTDYNYIPPATNTPFQADTDLRQSTVQPTTKPTPKTHQFIISYYKLTSTQNFHWSIPVLTTSPSKPDYSQHLYLPLEKIGQNRFSFDLVVDNNLTDLRLDISGPVHLVQTYLIDNLTKSKHDLTNLPILPGDISGAAGQPDGDINALDFSYLKSEINTGHYNPSVDLDQNSKLNSADISLLLNALVEKQNRIF